MVDFVVTTFRENVELAIFLTLGIGYALGKLRIGKFELGSVAGVLLAGIVVGQMGIEISPQVKFIFFILFLFGTGYAVGPEFIRGITKDGLPQALFALVICALCIGSTYVAAKIQGLDVGFAAGLHAGAQTISASLGLSTSAIESLGVPPDRAKELLGQISVAYAVAYLWGTIGCALIIAFVGPKLLGIDLAEECARYEQELAGGRIDTTARTAWRRMETRAYRLTEGGEIPVGMTVRDTEAALKEARLVVHFIRRDGEIIDFDESTVLQAGDIVAVSARREVIVGLRNADEVEDREMLEKPVEKVDVVLTSKAIEGATLLDMSKRELTRGVYLSKLVRGVDAEELPLLSLTTLHRGDVATVIGPPHYIQRFVDAVGYADRPSDVTDMIWVGIVIAIGGLIGAITVPVAGLPITLSTSGGALIAGIILGWLRSVYRKFGQVAGGALWMMKSVGLNVFIAVVGITSGPTFIAGLQEAGVAVFFSGIVVTSVPMLLAPLIGKYIFRFDPAINLGVCAGARTSVAAPAMLADVSKSNVPMLGYAVPFAVSSCVMALGGLILVFLLA